MLLSAAAVAIALWFGVAAFLKIERDAMLAAAERDVANLAAGFSEQTDWVLAATELFLNAVKADVEEEGEAFDLVRTLRRHPLPLGDVATEVAIVGADGFLSASNLDVGVVRPNHLDRAHVRVHLERDTGEVYVGPPIVVRPSGRWSIPISRRMNAPDGSFGGVALVLVNPFRLAASYRSLDLGSGGVVTLIGLDQIVRARSVNGPADSRGLGQAFPDARLFSELKRAPEGAYWSPAVANGGELVFGYKAVRRFPLVATVVRPKDEILAPWRSLAFRTVSAAVATTLIGALLAAWLAVEVRRRARAVQAVADRETLLRTVFESVPDHLYVMQLGRDGFPILEMVNSAGAAYLGGTPETIAGRSLGALMPLEVARNTRARFLACLEAGGPLRFETSSTWTGTQRDWEIVQAPIMGTDGPTRVVGMSREVTERNRREQILTEREALYRLLADNVNDMIALHTQDGTCLYMSPSCERILGHKPEDMVGMSPFHFVHPEDVEKLAEALGQVITSPEITVVLRFRMRRADGGYTMLETIGRYIGDGQAPKIVAVSRDVTMRAAEEAELREARVQAEAAARAKSEFLATMSHELRTPLNGIIGFSDLLLSGGLTEEERESYLVMLRDAGHSLLAIVNDVLDFSKIEAGKLELEIVPVHLCSLIEGCVALAGRDADAKGLGVAVEIADDLPERVDGDPVRLRQVLLNLLVNAVKFTETGGVRVHAARAAGAPDRLRVEVVDTGIGISAEVKARLFKSFSQADRTTTRRFGGTGLGLAICRRLVEAMGGAIGVESEPGVGSTFWFELPLSTTAVAEISVPHVASRALGLRVLLAEDNPENRTLATAILRKAGHSVAIAADGAAAVNAAQGGGYDLVFMDLQMPVMDGVEAARAIRALPGDASQVPIVALTANAVADVVARCQAAGMDGYLAKPYLASDLLAAASRYGRKRAHGGTGKQDFAFVPS